MGRELISRFEGLVSGIMSRGGTIVGGLPKSKEKGNNPNGFGASIKPAQPTTKPDIK
jgi:hypothetical protein